MCKYKLVILPIFLTISLFSNSFEKNCLSCHIQKRQLNMFINKYTIQYSSEKRIKEAIYKYLRNPSIEKSIMPRGFLNRFGVKEAINIDEKDLIESIDEYYKIYNITQKLR